MTDGVVDTEDDEATGRSAGPVRIIAAVVAVVLVALVALLAVSGSDNEGVDSALIGELVPHVQGETFAGDQFDIDEFRDRWVLVNFFASWCVPCRREHPELIDFAARHPDDALVVSIPFGDTETEARAFFEELGGDWPVLLDPQADFAVRFGVLRPPESYLIGPGGVVVSKWYEITADADDAVVARYQSGAS